MKKIKQLILFTLVMILCWSCVEERYDVDIDNREKEIGEVIFTPINPETGVAYTQNELAELDFDPSIEGRYLAEQPVEISLWTKGKPLKLEVRKSGEQTAVVTSNTYTEQDGGYLINLSTTVLELGIDEGSIRGFDFVIIYDDYGVNGFDYASVNKYTFKILYITAKVVAPFALLKRSSTDITELQFESNVANSGIEDGIGLYMEFDGLKDVVTITDPLDFVYTDDFSFSFWVNTTSKADDPSIIGNKDWGGGGNPGFVLAFRGDKDVKLNVGDGSNRVDINGVSINDGGWHHITCTFDRDGLMSLYQDGVLTASDDMSALGAMSSGFPIRVGQDGTGTYGQFFEGKVAGLVINNYVMSNEEVYVTLYKTASLIYFDETRNGTLDLENGAVSVTTENGMTVSEFQGAEFATVTDANGVLDYRHTGDYTFGLWVNTTSKADDPSIIGDKDWGGGGNPGFVLAFRGDKDIKLNIGDGTNRVDIKGTPINDGEWHFVMASFDRDGMVTLYQDGAQTASADMSLIGDMNSDHPVRIAQDGTGKYGQFFEGKVGRTVFFDRAVTAAEAANLYTSL
ncbi:concanavalin A-like lectin/glucanase superfamily protein [Arenibacter algicola]|uniref:Concanavalin A-like lectin/glucanase superfamily protein n=1 Tax=Arenibacter algicola TaxID=616991 RepID=A0ABY3AG28_9FLAO